MSNESAVILEAYRLSESLLPLMERHLAEAPLPGPDLVAYSLLEQLAPCTPGTLSEQAGVAPSTITAFLRRAEKRGHLDRLPVPGDRRSFRVALRPEGLEALLVTRERYRLLGDRVHRLLGSRAPLVREGLARLEAALRLAAGGHGDRDVEGQAERADPGGYALFYEGPPLQERQVEEVRQFVAWIRHRDRERG